MIALLGKRDAPTDGVDDYCNFLGQALARRGIALTRVHVDWDREGWIGALRRLRRDSADWNGQWVLLQYTALAWSRRGFPWGALAAAAILRRRGGRCAIVFHEASAYGATRWRERVRSACQSWILRSLYRKSERCVFTIPLDSVVWLAQGDKKSAFIPIGANIPECSDGPNNTDNRSQPDLTDGEIRVVVFGVTEFPVAPREVAEIADITRDASGVIPNLRLVVMGRGASEVREDLAKAVEGCAAILDVRGVLPAEEISREFCRAHALLYVRGSITLQRGSAIAGIACGLPIAGYGNGEPCAPLAGAGIEWAPWHDPKALAQALVRILSDPQRWMELHERNVRAHAKYFCWNRIAELYVERFAE